MMVFRDRILGTCRCTEDMLEFHPQDKNQDYLVEKGEQRTQEDEGAGLGGEGVLVVMRVTLGEGVEALE